MSADANDTSGVLNATRFKAAVDGVTGGVVDHRGNSLVAPWYGASQADFVDALNSVTADDMKGSVTRDGSPLSPAMLKPSFGDHFTWGNFKLQNAGIGNGRYWIYSGTDNAKQYLKDASGAPFELDLGAKRGAVDAYHQTPVSPEFYSDTMSHAAGAF
jgi:hypothetical protein